MGYPENDGDSGFFFGMVGPLPLGDLASLTYG